ncbi:hypothetical protein K488DRAFT_52260 [Vararia minispora EC-137]|uniref:Uncharacterized protein n=1 Tax=Vararia minispora EC-137 TaxID=1314806 RepID=A0ACB8QI90_9AGAM|nr:hypothetical protein K488DRAFT_52260 [Vararia minispora EC-137]
MYLSAESASSLAERARRRSVDVGGLALALGAEEGNQASGFGWGGWDQVQEEPQYAELLSKMYNDTHTALESGDDSTMIPPERDIRTQLINAADAWGFEPHKLPEEHLLYTSLLVFETLFRVEGVEEAVGVSIERIGELLCGLRKAYRQQNSYHNFQHAVDVLQATHHFLLSAGRVPPVSILMQESDKHWVPPEGVDPLAACLRPLDLFCLYVASIGHDVGHPGFTNTFMKNAKTPLAELYDDKSPLEHLHCTLLMHTLRRQGFGFLLDTPNEPHSFRKLLHDTVLATDMRVHADFMANFGRIVNGREDDLWVKRVLVCQAIIKWADISNPCRPLGVSQHWATALANEWTSQAVLEQYLNMPASLNPTEGPLSEARSQVFFIETFALPLFKLTGQGIPPAAPYASLCGSNLSVWKDRVHTLSSASCPDTAETESTTTATPSQLPEDFLTAFPMTLPSSLVNADHSERLSQSEWATSTASGSSESPNSPVLSPTDPPSAAPSRAMSIISTNSTTAGLSSILSASCVVDSGKAAIRAAYKASVRKKPSFQNRNSWSPAPRGTMVQVPGVSADIASGRIGALASNTPTTRREVPVADGTTK